MLDGLIKKLKQKFRPAQREIDWFEWCGMSIPSKLQLIEECQKNGVCIYVDDHLENPYSIIRGVASEAKLLERLYAKLALDQQTKRTKLDILKSLLMGIIKVFQ